MQENNLEKMFALLDIEYGEVETFLFHNNTYELLVAVILSAQTTDTLVNRITPKLFARYPDLPSLAQAEYGDVAKLIEQVNYFRNKAKYIITMAQILIEQHQGKIPQTIEELIRLPGVGRKVANVLISEEFDLAEGIVVDTHVKRVTFRLGLTDSVTPEKVERDLIKLFPKDRWRNLPKQLILVGRQYCFAGRLPNCSACPLNGICPKRV